MMVKVYENIKNILKNTKKENGVFLLIFFLLFSLSGCKHKKKELDSKILYFSFNTKYFHSPSNLPNFYLQKGWKKFPGEKEFSLLKKEGKILFQIYKKQNIEFNFLIKSGDRLRRKDNLLINLFLNNNFMKNIILTKEFKEHKVIFPLNLLKKGNNFILFKIPSEILNNEYPEDVVFKPNTYLKLKDFYIVHQKGKLPADAITVDERKNLVQRLHSQIYYYFYGNKIEKILLNLNYKGPLKKRLTMNISYESEKGVKGFIKKVVLKEKKITIKINLARFNKKNIYRLIFDLTGKYYQNFVVWKNIIVFPNNKKERYKKNYVSLKTKPNIYYILLDALRFDTIHKKINNIPLTSTINSFSNNSYEFKEFYAQAPYTRASVATLFTGLLPETHGVRGLADQLPSNLPTLPEILKNNGYYTSVIYGTEVLDSNNLIKDFNEKIFIRDFKGKNNTSAMSKKLLSYSLKQLINKNPKFVYIHILPPHEPYNPPPLFRKIFIDTSDYNQNDFVEIIDKVNHFENISPAFLTYLNKAYFNNVVYADFLVRRILRVLKIIGEYDNSIIIITADHGEAFFEHNKIGHNSTNYQEMIHIPFLLKLPHQKKKKVCYAKKGVVDILPTILELSKIKYDNVLLQGESFTSCFTNKNCNSDKFLYSRTTAPNYNISLIWNKYKYINYFGTDELYNLNNDPQEKNNIAEKYPFVTGYLRQKSMEIMYENIKLRKTHNISSFKKKLSKEEKQKLKSLGYL